MGVENPGLFANLLEGDEVARFLGQFVVPDSVRGTLPPATADRLPRNVADVLRDTKAIWQEKGLLTPAELRAELLQKYLADSPPAYQTLLRDLELSRNAPEQVTGYLNKEHAYTGTGLAHLYARETGRPISMIEVDFSNMGGTNEEFLRRMAARQNIPTTQIPRFMAEQMTDRAVKVLASGMTHDLAGSLPPNTRIVPIRTGGDEVRLIFEGDASPDLVKKLHDGIERRVADMGLQDHPHLKDPNNPVRNGFGAALTARDMRTITDPDNLIRALDDEIKHAKDDLGKARLEGAQAQALRARNPQHNPNLPQGLDGFNRYVDTTLPTLATPDLIPTRPLPAPLAGPVPIGAHRPDQVAPMATLDRRRFAMAQQGLDAQGVKPSALEGHFLRQSIVGLTPVDPAAQVHMPKDMVGLIEAYAAETQAFRQQFKPDDPAVKKALGDAGLASLADVKPHGLAVSYHGLAGLNSVLGHHQADLVLRHLGRDMIGESFRAAGVPADARPPYTIAHHGGGNFSVVVQPGMLNAQGEPVFMSPDRMKAVEEGIQQRLEKLNATPVAEVLARQGVPVDDALRQHLKSSGVNTFADLPDSKPRDATTPDGRKVQGRVNGLMAVTTTAPIDNHLPATHILGNLRNTADTRMDAAREARVLAQPTSHPTAASPTPEVSTEPPHTTAVPETAPAHAPVAAGATLRGVAETLVPMTKGGWLTTGVLALAAGVGTTGYNLWQGRGLGESAGSGLSTMTGFANPIGRTMRAAGDPNATGLDVSTALAEDVATFGGGTAAGVWAGTQLGAACLPGGPIAVGGCALAGGVAGGFLGAAAVERAIDYGRIAVDATGRFIGDTWESTSNAFNRLVSGKEEEKVDLGPLAAVPLPEAPQAPTTQATSPSQPSPSPGRKPAVRFDPPSGP